MDIDNINEVFLKKGEVLFRQGEECSTMFILMSGKVGQYCNYQKKNEFALSPIESIGSSIGEMGLLQGEKRNATVVALEDTSLIELTHDNVEQFIKNNPQMGFKMIKDLSLRFHRLTEEFLATKDILFKTLTVSETKSLRGKFKKFVNILTGVPEGVSPELYIECYIKNHTPLN